MTDSLLYCIVLVEGVIVCVECGHHTISTELVLEHIVSAANNHDAV